MVVKLTGKFLDENLVVVDVARVDTRRTTAVGTGFEVVAHLAAVIAAVVFGEELADVFARRREVVG